MWHLSRCHTHDLAIANLLGKGDRIMLLKDELDSTKGLSIKDRSDALKRLFEPYTDNVDVTGYEFECLCILTNLTSKDAAELTNHKHAKQVLAVDAFWLKFKKVVSQLHTHNLKWPDSRVSLKHQIRALPKVGQLPKLGWSGNSSDYRVGRFLTATFICKGDEHSLVSVWLKDHLEWRKAAYRLGISKVFWYQIKQELEAVFSDSHFPEVVDQHSPELLFPYKNHYLSITPVASHATQQFIQRVNGLPVHTLSFPHPCAVGSLCGSLGGHVRMLKFSPFNSQQANQISQSGFRSYLDPHVLTTKYANRVYQAIVDVKTYSSLRLKRRARLKTLNALDGLLVDWLAPLIQAKLSSCIGAEIECLNDEERLFLNSSDPDLLEFSRYLNRKWHGELESSKYSKLFSYHQRLIGVTQKRLVAHLEGVFLDNTKPESSDQIFLVLKGLRVNEANGLNNPYVAGMPSMIGLYGFLHKFERQLSGIYPNVRVASFALQCSQYSSQASIALPAPSSPDKEMCIKRSGVMPEFSFDGKFSIVVKLKILTDDQIMLDIEQIKASLPERLWGGSVHPPFLYEDTEWAAIVYGIESLKKYFVKNLYFGNWISPVKQDGLDFSGRVELLKEKYDLSLCLVGYKLLEEIKPRTVTSGIHAFCEPLVDLCQLLPTYKLLKTRQTLEQALFWEYVPVSQSCTTLRVSQICGDPHAASQSTEL